MEWRDFILQLALLVRSGPGEAKADPTDSDLDRRIVPWSLAASSLVRRVHGTWAPGLDYVLTTRVISGATAWDSMVDELAAVARRMEGSGT